jgi:ABC-type transport system substrate-binding protein
LIILGSALVATQVTGAVNPTPPYFELWASLGPDRFWGYYAGYHDIMYKLQPEWAKLGINLELLIQGDMYDNWYLIWESPLGGQPPGKPPGHWDLTPFEWWIHPHGFLWMDGIILSEMITPAGFNAEPYLSKEQDELYKRMQESFEADVRKRYCLELQEYWMKNPPLHNWYYPHIYQLRSKYIGGWYATTWFYDVSHMYINQTLVELLQARDPTILGANYARLATEKTMVYGAGEAWWSYLNLFCDSYTEEAYQNLITCTLYASSLDPWPAEGTLPALEDFIFAPKLAESDPWELPSVANGTGDDDPYEEPYVVKLRPNVKWDDGENCTAEDVVFSHRLSLDPLVLSTAYGDFAPVVKRVEYCDSNNNTVAGPLSPGYDPLRVKYVLYDDNVDLKLYLGNAWGAGIMPEHALGHLDPYAMRNAPVNKQFVKARDQVPALGPYKFYVESTPAGYSDITLIRNPDYFGYDLGWGPYGIDKIIFKYSPDAEVRFAEMETHAQDLAEYPTAPIATFETLDAENPDEFYLMKAPYVASNIQWFNFNNPQLSNRYVRLATAYATPYDEIFSEILPAWGIVDPVPPKSYVLPWSIYTEPASYGGETVSLYNTEIDSYTYDMDIAQQYMNMWLYSLDAAIMPGNDLPANYAKGPVGDANFDGEVGLRDVFLTLDEFGNAPLTRQIDWWNTAWSEGIYPWPVASGASVAPGNDVDPDFDNDGTVTSADFALCVANWGAKYPFEGAW